VPVLDPEEIHDFLEEIAPGSTASFVIEDVGERTARVRMPFSRERLRPGGIVGGPALMTLADAAVWVALLGEIGRVAHTVTVSLTIHFLRPAAPADVVAETRLHKVGKRLAMGDVLMYSVDAHGAPVDDPVAHATVTYSHRP
jgi:uncharacterized protein (TIGR00369 family)